MELTYKEIASYIDIVNSTKFKNSLKKRNALCKIKSIVFDADCKVLYIPSKRETKKELQESELISTCFENMVQLGLSRNTVNKIIDTFNKESKTVSIDTVRRKKKLKKYKHEIEKIMNKYKVNAYASELNADASFKEAGIKNISKIESLKTEIEKFINNRIRVVYEIDNSKKFDTIHKNVKHGDIDFEFRDNIEKINKIIEELKKQIKLSKDNSKLTLILDKAKEAKEFFIISEKAEMINENVNQIYALIGSYGRDEQYEQTIKKLDKVKLACNRVISVTMRKLGYLGYGKDSSISYDEMILILKDEIKLIEVESKI